ncbi:hypothetical protein BCR44DRAFT_1431913 [Catenaria anguillulae PL171]|uniref:Chromatin assembly factor 1 subunit A dimerization domain-containing protein n=1 Tax=Catenaria anguillulae PL171 TaxID=765915 RepID=A0A1Y2HQJ3_9FUNG|nr:hypothetical protein BCR44DRAFT_1431913 [Catenaria anguillulae PL171]
MDMFVKRVVKPSASDVSSACTGGADAQAAEQQHVEVKYFDTLFVDFVPKRTMTVVPLTHFQRVQDDDAATKSAIDILRSPARHASNLPMLPTHLRQTLVGLPLTDPETANATPLPRFKLLQFAEDLRPAYWGTWRKTSAHYDSEAEWQDEDEGEGEEIRSEDEADEDESVAGDDVEDDGWLLDDDEFARSAGTSVAAAGGKRVVRSLEPIVLGPFWGGQAKGVDGFAMVWLGENAAPLDPFAGLDLSVAPSKTNNAHSGSSAALGGGSGATPASASRKSNASLFPEEHILTFIRAVHGNPQGVQKIVEELKARPEFASTPKTQLEAKLKASLSRKSKLTFYVKDDILRYHRLSPTTLQVEPADPENENENDSDQASQSSAKLPATGTPSTALPRLPFKPLLLAAAVKRTADNATMRAKVAGNGLPPLPVAKVRDENENGGLPGVAKEDDEEELGSDDSDDEEEDDEEWDESDEDAGDDGTEQLAFPSPTPLSAAFRRRPSTALPPPPAHHTLPPPPPAENDDAMDVDDPDPLLDLSVYDLSTLSGSTTSVALAALGTWAASTRLPDSASQLSSSDLLVASPDFWALLPRCLASRDLRANSLRMMQPACHRTQRDGSYVWQAVKAAVSEKDVLGINYGLAVVGDMAGVPVDVGEDGERVVEQVWAKVRQVDLVTHGRRCALAAMYQYLSTLVDFENEALVAQVMERGGAKQAYRLRVQALNELEWVKMEQSFAKTVDECVTCKACHPTSLQLT